MADEMRHAQSIRLKFRWTRLYKRVRYDDQEDYQVVSEVDSGARRQTYVVTRGHLTWIHSGDYLSRLSKEGYRLIKEQLF